MEGSSDGFSEEEKDSCADEEEAEHCAEGEAEPDEDGGVLKGWWHSVGEGLLHHGSHEDGGEDAEDTAAGAGEVEGAPDDAGRADGSGPGGGVGEEIGKVDRRRLRIGHGVMLRQAGGGGGRQICWRKRRSFS